MIDFINTDRHKVYYGLKSGNIRKGIFEEKNIHLIDLKDVINHKKNEEWSFSKSKDEFKDDVFVFKFPKGEYQRKIKVLLEKLSIPPNFTYNLKNKSEDEYTILIYFFDVRITDKEIIKYVLKGFIKLLGKKTLKSIQFENYWYPTGGNIKIHKEEYTEFILFHALSEIGYFLTDKNKTDSIAKEKKRRGDFKNGIQFKCENNLINEPNKNYYKSLRYSEGFLRSKIPRLNEVFEIGNADFRELFSLGSLLTKTKLTTNVCNKILKQCSKSSNEVHKKIFAEIPRVFLNNLYPEIKFFDRESKYSFLLSGLFESMPKSEFHQNKNIELFELEDIELQFKEFMQYFLKIDKGNSCGDEGVHCLKAAAGIGKTETILKLRNSVIAFPTHDLKNDFVDRISQDYPEIEFRVTPQLPSFSNNINAQFKFLYESGKQALVKKLLNDLTENPESIGGNSEDQELALKYLQDLEKAYESGEFLILTTHQRAILTKFERPLIVFDEDPHNFLLEQNTFKISDLEKYVGRFSEESIEFIALSKLLDVMKNPNSKNIHITPAEVFANSFMELAKKVTGSDQLKTILNFLSSHSFNKKGDSIQYIMKRSFPEGVTCLVMSASLPINLYQKLCGDRLGGFLDLSMVKHKGNVEQFPLHSFSKSTFDHWFTYIQNRVNNRFVITYKNKCIKFNTALETPKIYFFNCSGYDELKGQEIMVVGTPYHHLIRYQLIGSVLGIDVYNLNNINDTVIRNGRSAKLNVLNEPSLREIQLDLLEGELLQAIGRARALRESKAKVTIYSSFPLPQFVKFNAQGNNSIEDGFHLVPVETL